MSVVSIEFDAKRVTRNADENQENGRQQGMQIFSSPDFGQIRVVMRDGEPWFLAADVCAVLETRTNDALGSLEDDERGYDNVVTPSGVQQMGIVSEPGLYSLILRSRARKDNPELTEKIRRFRRWVTHDLIPAVRKTGYYSIAGVPVPRFDNPAEAARAWADQYEARMLAEQRAELEAARADEAIRTKAEIGSRREATAMATASAAVRRNTKLTAENASLTAENAELKDERGKGENFKAATNIPWIKSFFDVTLKGAWSQIGKALSKVTKALGLEARKVQGEKYDVKAYPLQAVEEFKRQVEADGTLLQKYRLS